MEKTDSFGKTMSIKLILEKSDNTIPSLCISQLKQLDAAIAHIS